MLKGFEKLESLASGINISRHILLAKQSEGLDKCFASRVKWHIDSLFFSACVLAVFSTVHLWLRAYRLYAPRRIQITNGFITMMQRGAETSKIVASPDKWKGSQSGRQLCRAVLCLQLCPHPLRLRIKGNKRRNLSLSVEKCQNDKAKWS